MKLLDQSRCACNVWRGHARALEKGEAWRRGTRSHQYTAVQIDSRRDNVGLDLVDNTVLDHRRSNARESRENVRARTVSEELLACRPVNRDRLGGRRSHGQSIGPRDHDRRNRWLVWRAILRHCRRIACNAVVDYHTSRASILSIPDLRREGARAPSDESYLARDVVGN